MRLEVGSAIVITVYDKKKINIKRVGNRIYNFIERS